MLLTGVVYQYLFSRRLTRTQWLSLLLVTVGCMVQKMELPQQHPTTSNDDGDLAKSINGSEAAHDAQHNNLQEGQLLTVGFGLLFIFVQVKNETTI